MLILGTALYVVLKQETLRSMRVASVRNADSKMKRTSCRRFEGRLFTPHCKIGDTVYIPDVEKGIAVPVRVQGISIAVSGRVLLHFGGYPAECAWDHDCGKGWYKTREEAEKALEEAK